MFHDLILLGSNPIIFSVILFSSKTLYFQLLHSSQAGVKLTINSHLFVQHDQHSHNLNALFVTPVFNYLYRDVDQDQVDDFDTWNGSIMTVFLLSIGDFDVSSVILDPGWVSPHPKQTKLKNKTKQNKTKHFDTALKLRFPTKGLRKRRCKDVINRC